MKTDPPETFTLTIIAIQDPDRPPAIVRLRRLLKTLLRGFGFRLVTLNQVKPTDQ